MKHAPENAAAQAEREARLAACEQALGHRFLDRSLLELALTHSSLRDPWTQSNERLEFLGDSVIGLAVSEHLFCTLGDRPEGDLTHVKSRVVSRSALARVGSALDLKKYLRVGKGIRQRRSIPPSLIANALEALVGAVYLDAGFEAARALVLRLVEPLFHDLSGQRVLRNFKAALQQAVQRLFGVTPTYNVLEAVGPDHSKEFLVEAVAGGRSFPPARGRSKKQAEQRAAREALRVLKQEHGHDLP